MNDKLTLFSTARRRLGTRAPAEGWVGAVGIMALCGVLWEGIVHFGNVPAYLVPGPTRILATMWEKRTFLALDSGITMAEAAVGFLVANAVSCLTAVAFFYSRLAERAILPLLVGFKAVPVVATAPLLVLWFGYGFGSKVIVAAIVAFFPVVVGMTAGIRSVSAESIDMMRALSASRWETLTKLCLPTALPQIFAALKVSSTLAVVGAIVGELTGARHGLGFTILMASYNVDTPLLFCAIVLSAAIGGMIYLAVVMAERALWRYRLGHAIL